MFIKMPFTAVQSEQEKEEIINQAVTELKKDLFIDGKWYADYVRIRMKAVQM